MVDRDAFAELLQGRRPAIILGPQRQPRLLLCGAFDPLHEGHRQMARCARSLSGEPAAFELSLTNVDKPSLSWEQARHRVLQFAAEDTVVLTNAPRFVDKLAAFSQPRFVVGLDTILRLADPRYCRGPDEHQRQLRQLARHSRGFLVFGRLHAGRFQTLHDIRLPGRLRQLCTAVDEAGFRIDISSSELRNSQTEPDGG
jgi:hypothetical protein